jgi:sulfur relay (sulfurtransferase) complex TusBCD TusD component (DsrE family)
VPSGFVSEAATPQFINVQCENCHGPAGTHVGSGDPPTVFPIKTRSPILCGGCHNGFHHPTYDEWTSSPHSAVVEALAGAFSSTNRTTAIGRMTTCGACHSGATRLAMLAAYSSANRTNVAWPSGFDATNTPISCIVCHDPHRVRTYTNVLTGVLYTNQLRHPLTSTNLFSYNTSLPFASNYNASVNICAQCHNARGASVTSSSRAPHYSPQYNVFLGVIGVTTNSTPPQGAHRNNPRQCAGCHTHRHNEVNPDPSNPAYTGHAFRPSIESCAACHTETIGPNSPTNRLFTTQAEISATIATTKNLLDLWATTKNTNAWAPTYEALGWEYTNPGELSNPSGSTSIVGPNSTEQGQIPQGIKDARFNLYLIAHDQSLGIHNAPYTRYLLQVAQQKVNVELAQ